MSLIKRESTPAQVAANRANSLRSTGPRTPMGLEVSARNLPRQRRFSEVVARSMEMLGEAPGDFERMHQTLSEALRPRDSWEAATVQDLAILRHRLERLHRAELAAAALRRRRAHYQRQIAVAAPTGIDAFQLNTQIASAGYTGIPDCPLKFHLIFDLFQGLKRNLLIEQFEKDDPLYFKLLYGEARGTRAVELQTRFDRIAEQYRGGNPGDTIEDRKSLCAELDKEIEHYQKLQELCVAEYVESDPLQDDADSLPPLQEMDAIIRYETHLETRIEAKLRQLYARRRESLVEEAETSPTLERELAARGLAMSAAAGWKGPR